MTPVRQIAMDCFGDPLDAALALAGYRTARAIANQVLFENLERLEERLQEYADSLFQDHLRQSGYAA